MKSNGLQNEKEIRTLSTELLIDALNGDINVLRLIHEELADRGFSAITGDDIGYMRASDELHDRWAGEDMEI